MPPRRRPAAPQQKPAAPQAQVEPLYSSATGYYKAAYRRRIKVLRPTWTTAQITGTLVWLWMHASAAEKLVAATACNNADQNLPATDDATIPNEPKTRLSPAPVVAPVVAPVPNAVQANADGDESAPDVPDDVGRDVGGTIPSVPEVQNAIVTAAGNDDRPGGSVVDPNTTTFSFWPDPATMMAELPKFEPGASEDKQEKAKRKFLEAGLSDPTRESEGKRWHGAHFLGQGATGRAGMWIRVDDSEHITERIAARDVATIRPDAWTHAINWRDRLPREIAIQVRLNGQEGYNHNIHKYLGHRVSLHLRRYRVYNEVCGMGDLLKALGLYESLWWARRTMFRWLDTHREIVDAKRRVALSQASAEDFAKLDEVKKAAWKEYRLARRRRESDKKKGITEDADPTTEHYRRNNAEFDDLPGVGLLYEGADKDTWDELMDEMPALPATIDEGFLWHVFDSLANALEVLKNGTGRLIERKAWKEIMHVDLHLMNVFVKPPEPDVGVTKEESSQDGEVELSLEYTGKEWPTIVLADFDRAFFDLQSGEDVYADNPIHYMMGDQVQGTINVLARYPPELFFDYEGHRPHAERLSSKTDVWGLGQIMWNLVMQHNLSQAPFYDGNGTDTDKLVNGQPYDYPGEDRIMTGTTPFESSNFYSADLKTLIRDCLQYRQDDRPTIEEVKTRTAKGLETSTSPQGVLFRFSGALHSFRLGEAWFKETKQRQSEENSEDH